MACACALQNDMCVCTTKRYAHAHTIFACTRAYHFRMSIYQNHMGLRNAICYANAHLILWCACASHFGLHLRISLLGAQAHVFLVCTAAPTYLISVRTPGRTILNNSYQKYSASLSSIRFKFLSKGPKIMLTS